LDLAAIRLLGLRDPDTENTVLRSGLDTTRIDAVGESEDARKLASTTLSDQVLCFILCSLSGRLVLILSSDLSTGLAGFAAVLGCALIALLLLFATLGDGASGLLTSTQVAWKCVGPFDLSPNGEGPGAGELNLYILLFNTRKLAV
jgi:hypothetical protein